jgi:2,3-bisphosphoglycerate-dependent phosphoglycerate mutase
LRYATLGKDLPRSECLKDVVTRMIPYFTNEITADLRSSKVVLVTAHGNSIRAIVKHIDCISDADIAKVNIPTGIPLYYEFDNDFEPITKSGRYLDPEAAKAAIEAVANQGKK